MRRWQARLVWMTLLGVLIAGLAFAAREPILRRAGHLLVAEDPLAPADVVIVPSWAGNGGAIEAADLYDKGLAPRVVILFTSPGPADRELLRRSVVTTGDLSWMVRLVKSLGVASVAAVSQPVEGTEDESGFIPRWCREQHVASAIVVSTPDHSRRLRRSLRRTGAGATARVRVTRYADFDPDSWWRTRSGLRIGLEELPKLILDVIRHPFS